MSQDNLRLRQLFTEEDLDPAAEIIELYRSVKSQRMEIIDKGETEDLGGVLGISRLTNESSKIMMTALKMLGEMEQKEIDQAIELQKMADRRAESEPKQEPSVAYIPQYQTKRLADGREVVIAVPMIVGGRSTAIELPRE